MLIYIAPMGNVAIHVSFLISKTGIEIVQSYVRKQFTVKI